MAASAATFDAASAVLQDPALKLYALEAVARLYDDGHLAEPAGMEQALRAMVPLMPGNSTPLRRVAQLQEAMGLVDAAENTLLDARQQAPGDVEIYRTLSHFYARRAVQIAAETARVDRDGVGAPRPGEPDADGYYRVGGTLSAPAPVSTPAPQRIRGTAASAAAGSVVLEVRVDEWGAVSAARIVQSVPMLDDAVLAAVRRWRYTPSTVEDRAVPVKMMVVVNVPALPR
ncbi:MAG: TonB family protein [Acidobacteriota bacterium]